MSSWHWDPAYRKQPQLRGSKSLKLRLRRRGTAAWKPGGQNNASGQGIVARPTKRAPARFPSQVRQGSSAHLWGSWTRELFVHYGILTHRDGSPASRLGTGLLNLSADLLAD